MSHTIDIDGIDVFWTRWLNSPLQYPSTRSKNKAFFGHFWAILTDFERHLAGSGVSVGWIRPYGLKGIHPIDFGKSGLFHLTTLVMCRRPPCYLKIEKKCDFPLIVGIDRSHLENHPHANIDPRRGVATWYGIAMLYMWHKARKKSFLPFCVALGFPYLEPFKVVPTTSPISGFT